MVQALFEAHYRSSFRNNISSVVVANAAAGSGDLVKAIAAGLLTLGNIHAPIEQTYEFLNQEMPWNQANYLLQQARKVPGWGGSFQKDKPDPLWDEIAGLLQCNYPALHNKLYLTTQWIHSHKKIIYPNPSAYTAATALALGLTKKEAPYLFIAGRLDAWARIAMEQIENGGLPISAL